jgi:hypothetical protein
MDGGAWLSSLELLVPPTDLAAPAAVFEAPEHPLPVPKATPEAAVNVPRPPPTVNNQRHKVVGGTE